MHESVPAIAALGVSPIVRIPGMEPWMVKRRSRPSSHKRSTKLKRQHLGALDCGAHGVSSIYIIFFFNEISVTKGDLYADTAPLS